MANINAHLTLAQTKNKAIIITDQGVQAELIRNGFCPYHADIQLRIMNAFGVWKTVRASCPHCECERMNIQGTPAATTQMAQSPPMPVTQSQASNQIPTTSNSPLDKTFANLAMNDSNNLTNTEADLPTATSVSSPIAEILPKMKKVKFTNPEIPVESLSDPILLAEKNIDNYWVKIFEAGGFTTILSAMKNDPMNAIVQYYGFRALSSLAENQENQLMIAEVGGITTILSAMIIHSSNANVQEYGCVALQKLAENENNKVAIVDTGGITTILSAMKTHFSNANVQVYGCAALCNLAENNDENKVMIAEAGGITTILSAMKTHFCNADVQEYGCAALEQLVVNNNNNEVTSTEAGLEISVKWLKENEPSLFKLYLPDKSIGDDSKAIAETLKVNTFLTIPNLSRNYKSNISLNPSHVPTHQDVQFVNEYARQKECTLSQIAAIHSEMQMNEQNADIQEGLLNLQNVANDDNNEVTIAEAGGITTILSAMKFHSSNANKVVIADAEGITMILSAMTPFLQP